MRPPAVCAGLASPGAAIVVFTDISPAAAPASSGTEARLSIITPQICLLRAQSNAQRIGGMRGTAAACSIRGLLAPGQAPSDNVPRPVQLQERGEDETLSQSHIPTRSVAFSVASSPSLNRTGR